MTYEALSFFALGVASSPLVLAVLWVLAKIAVSLYNWYTDLRANQAIVFNSSRTRSYNAASIMYTKRFYAISLPGYVVMWRAKTKPNGRPEVMKAAEEIRSIVPEEEL